MARTHTPRNLSMVNEVVYCMVIHIASHRVSMPKAKHKPPSRLRYEESHPVVSCRLSRHVDALLKQRLKDLGEISFAQFIKESLGLQEAKMPDIRERNEIARKKGYNQALKEYRISYPCPVCGERIDITPNSESHKAIMGYMKKDNWAHTSCHGG